MGDFGYHDINQNSFGSSLFGGNYERYREGTDFKIGFNTGAVVQGTFWGPWSDWKFTGGGMFAMGGGNLFRSNNTYRPDSSLDGTPADVQTVHELAAADDGTAGTLSKPGNPLNLPKGNLSAIRKGVSRIEEHEAKINQYRNNPLSMDNKGTLTNPKSAPHLEQIQQGRIQVLEKAIGRAYDAIIKALSF